MIPKNRLVLGALTSITLLAGTPVFAGSNITLCGGSPGGLWSLLGAGIDSAVRKIEPNSTVTYQTSSGGFANIVQVANGKCDLGIVHIGEVLIAQRGEKPFKKPTGGVSAISMLYDWAPMQWVTDKSYAEKNGLKSIADLASFKGEFDLVVNRKGILPSILAEKSLAATNVTFDGIENGGGSVQFQGSGGASKVMQDGKADTWVNATFVGSGKIRAIAKKRDLTLLSVPNDIISMMQKNYGSKPVTIPAGAYPWLDREIKTFGASAALIASETADPKLVKLIASAIFNHPGEIQAVHKAMKAFNGNLGASISQFDYHPIAAKVISGAGY